MDTGAHAVGEFLSMHQKLRTLHLTNNNIGPNGVAGIVHGLMKANSTALKNLDLRLNPLQNEGMNHICACKFVSSSYIIMSLVLLKNCTFISYLLLNTQGNTYHKSEAMHFSYF